MMSSNFLSRAALLLTLFVLWPALAPAQDNERRYEPPPPPLPAPTPSMGKTDADGWRLIFLSRGSFKMPGQPVMSDRQFQTSVGLLTMHSYLLKTDKANYLLSYIDFPVSVTDPVEIRQTMDAAMKAMLGRTQSVKVLGEREIKFAGYPGKEWLMRIGETVVQSKAMMAGKVIYNLVLSTPRGLAFKPDKTDEGFDNLNESYQATAKRFFDSFHLYNYGGGSAVKPGSKEAEEEQKKIVRAGVLNAKAVSLPKPDYPREAIAQRVTGTVVVMVQVDEEGKVVAARAISGHPLLQATAEQAARQARFKPFTVQGQPVRVNGVITYNFQF